MIAVVMAAEVIATYDDNDSDDDYGSGDSDVWDMLRSDNWDFYRFVCCLINLLKI